MYRCGSVVLLLGRCIDLNVCLSAVAVASKQSVNRLFCIPASDGLSVDCSVACVAMQASWQSACDMTSDVDVFTLYATNQRWREINRPSVNEQSFDALVVLEACNCTGCSSTTVSLCYSLIRSFNT